MLHLTDSTLLATKHLKQHSQRTLVFPLSSDASSFSKYFHLYPQLWQWQGWAHFLLFHYLLILPPNWVLHPLQIFWPNPLFSLFIYRLVFFSHIMDLSPSLLNQSIQRKKYSFTTFQKTSYPHLKLCNAFITFRTQMLKSVNEMYKTVVGKI